MTFLSPGSFYLLGIIPALAGLYIWIQHRRQRYTVRFSSLALLREILPAHSWLRRHLPFLLFLGALGSLALALTRPVSIVSAPAAQTTIVLSIDVSRSMCSTDIPPNRLQAAKAAALAFVGNQDSSRQIGIVAFSGFAELIQPPTSDQTALRAAIQSLITGRRTAIGSGILEALDAIAEVEKNVAPSSSGSTPGADVAPVPKGAYAPDIIVLLTDGASNTGPLPVQAAQQAADRGVRVYAIGFGTARGSELPNCGQQFIGGEPFGFGGGQGFSGGGGFRRGIDEETLKRVAAITDAKYYSAESAGQLQQVFRDLPTYLITKHQMTELTAICAAAGAFLAMVAMGLSLAWHPIH